MVSYFELAADLDLCSLIAGGVFGLFKRDKAIPFAPFMGMGLLIANVARTKGFI
jgi:prepilin signal peptidase PulO-like enzyme (type II secretory pathway)